MTVRTVRTRSLFRALRACEIFGVKLELAFEMENSACALLYAGREHVSGRRFELH